MVYNLAMSEIPGEANNAPETEGEHKTQFPLPQHFDWMTSREAYQIRSEAAEAFWKSVGGLPGTISARSLDQGLKPTLRATKRPDVPESDERPYPLGSLND